MKRKYKSIFMKNKKVYQMTMYVLIGGITTLINIMVYTLTSAWLGVDYRLGTIIAWCAAVLFAYFANKKWVFISRVPTLKALMIESGLFFGFRLFSLLIDLGVMIALVGGMHINGTISKILSNIFVLAANFIFSKTIIFRNRTERGG